MKYLVFLLEERSAEELLKGILPNIIQSKEIQLFYIPFEGKQDLDKQVVRKIKNWKTPNTQFVILRDKDSSDCMVIKQNLKELCQQAGRPDTLIRIACSELESWYIGDLPAVEQAFNLRKISVKRNVRKYRNPDTLSKPSIELNQLTNNQYQKINGSRTIAPLMKIAENQSHSFQVFIDGMKKVIKEMVE